ncbi:hypothetical protein BGX31_004320 [Mortierella sp. GBA43]|nr:hypothetical protein BGX31_004320 [Mortierella sp. GBA43]
MNRNRNSNGSSESMGRETNGRRQDVEQLSTSGDQNDHGELEDAQGNSAGDTNSKKGDKTTTKERLAGPKPLPRLSTSLGSQFTIDNPISSVLPRAPTFNNGAGSSLMTQQLTIHVEQLVGSMSISPSSRDVVLAARKGLFIIDLENPYDPPRVLHHLTKWEVADVQWNPHYSRENWIASTSNQKALVWNLAYNAPPGATVVKFNRKDEHTLASAHDTKVEVWDIRKGSTPFITVQAHKQKINGIDWSRKHRNHMVTCSLDKIVKFWDIDNPDQPHNEIVTKSPVWRARHTPFGHGIVTMPQRTETALSLWNRDKPEEPVCRFEGHTDTVKEFVWRIRDVGNSEDSRLYQLVTWSKDQHLRLWPISEKMLEAMDHKVTTPMDTAPYPQTYESVSFRDPPPLHMAVTPSKTLPSMRILSGNRFSTMTPFRTSMSSRTLGPTENQPGGFYRDRKAPSPLVWMQGVRMIKPSGDLGVLDRASPQTVATEIAAVGQKFQNVKFEKVNVTGRTCTISLNSLRSNEGISFIRVSITFPQFYPKQAPPTFEIQKSGTMSMETRRQISVNLDRIAATHASRGLPCLEAIIRCLLGEDRRDEVVDRELDDSDEDDAIVNPLRKSRGRDSNAGEKKDQLVPFPCLCGAVFATNGKLVTFFSKLRTPHTAPSSVPLTGRSTLIKSQHPYAHPRTYASMGEYKAFSRLPTGAEGLAGTVSSLVQDDDQDDLWTLSTMSTKTKPKPERVRVTLNPKDQSAYYKPPPQSRSALYLKDITHMLPVSPRLAAVYTLTGDNVSEICEHNALQARHLGRMDLFKIWKLAALILALSVPMDPVAFEMSRAEISRMTSQTHPDKLLDLLSRCSHAKECRENGKAFVPVIEDTFYQKIRWGTHPLGRKLVEVLFAYLERHGDIQTLALLSCVFKDPFRNTMSVTGITPPQAHYRSHQSPMGDAPDYFNSRQAVNSRSVSGLPMNATPMSVDLSSVRPRTPAATVTRTSPYLNRMSPPTGAFGSSYSSMRRTPSRFHTGIGSSPLATPSSLRESYPDAPLPLAPIITNAYATQATMYQEGTVQQPRYTHSKRDSYNSMQGSSPTLLSKLGPSHRRESSSSPSQVEKGVRLTTVRLGGFTLTKMNIGAFDSDETPMNTPLLDPLRETQHNTWRLLYAEMMYSWGLFEARSELLKFLTLKPFATNHRYKEDQSPLDRLLGIEKRGPQIFNKCFDCENRLFPTYKCDFCQQMRIGIKCTICHISVRGITSACLKCAHGGHTEHLKEWFILQKNKLCPTGCGCECLVNYGGWAGGLAIQPIHQQQLQQESF